MPVLVLWRTDGAGFKLLSPIPQSFVTCVASSTKTGFMSLWTTGGFKLCKYATAWQFCFCASYYNFGWWSGCRVYHCWSRSSELDPLINFDRRWIAFFKNEIAIIWTMFRWRTSLCTFISDSTLAWRRFAFLTLVCFTATLVPAHSPL